LVDLSVRILSCMCLVWYVCSWRTIFELSMAWGLEEHVPIHFFWMGEQEFSVKNIPWHRLVLFTSSLGRMEFSATCRSGLGDNRSHTYTLSTHAILLYVLITTICQNKAWSVVAITVLSMRGQCFAIILMRTHSHQAHSMYRSMYRSWYLIPDFESYIHLYDYKFWSTGNTNEGRSFIKLRITTLYLVLIMLCLGVTFSNHAVGCLKFRSIGQRSSNLASKPVTSLSQICSNLLCFARIRFARICSMSFISLLCPHVFLFIQCSALLNCSRESIEVRFLEATSIFISVPSEFHLFSVACQSLHFVHKRSLLSELRYCTEIFLIYTNSHTYPLYFKYKS
jgi:hypothetical protein